MRTLTRVLVITVAALLLFGCTARQRPGANASPDAGSGDPVVAQSSSVLPDLTPKADLAMTPAGEVNVSYAPDVPPAATRTNQVVVNVAFDIVEGVQAIDPNGTQYETWGYRLHGDTAVETGTPGPMIRARVGDLLRFSLTNLPGNKMPHNVDFHAVTGQGGGAADTTVAPGETAVIEARLLYPGIFMYHCAAGDVPTHIAQGMYGGILVDPATPLPPVEHELYMVQSEYYTAEPGEGGILLTDRAALSAEHPTHVVFNGAVGALTGDNAPTMRVGEHMRIYFVNAGLNLDSNFHAIGSHWDKVWQEGALLNNPLRGSQTTLVPAGGGTVVEMIGLVPMTAVLVDHALTRAFDKGAIGQIVITGDPNTEIFESIGKSGSPAPLPTAEPSAPSTPGASEAPPTDGPAESGAPASPSSDALVSIVEGAFNFQADNAPDEFAETEVPADYSPNVLMIPLGTTVTWTNNDPGVMHTVTSVDGAFDSGMLNTGDTWSYTFDQPGDFDYLCTPHPWMKGRISVMMH